MILSVYCAKKDTFLCQSYILYLGIFEDMTEDICPCLSTIGLLPRSVEKNVNLHSENYSDGLL